MSNDTSTYLPFVSPNDALDATASSRMVAEERHDPPRDLYQTSDLRPTTPNMTNTYNAPLAPLTADEMNFLSDALDEFDEPTLTKLATGAWSSTPLTSSDLRICLAHQTRRPARWCGFP